MSRMSRNPLRLLLTASLLALGLATALPAFAEAYPARPLKLIVPFPPGGTADVLARLIADKLAAALGQPVVIENKGGAGGVVGTVAAAKAAPDGYTALLTTTAVAVNPSLNPNAGYDAKKDLTPVIKLASSPNVLLATPALGAGTLPQAIAKARAGKLNYGTPGNGTTPHLSTEYLFKSLAKVDVAHIPYKGGGPALAAGIGGEVQFVAIPLPPAVPQIKAGKLVPLAVTGASRSPVLPTVPTVAEAGFPGFEDSTWVGLFLPAGAPPEAVARLHAEVEKLLARADVREQLAAIGYTPAGGSPASFAAYLRQEVAKWRRIVKETGIQAE